jgi:catechol 2,3-dioxygenase-like lactoylglutathione lyase family enzyme
MHLRIARPVSDLRRAEEMYRKGLGLELLDRFEGHDGFDGVMLGAPGGAFHFEFTRCRAHPVAPSPTPEDLAVFYVPRRDEWRRGCANLRAAGFRPVASFNPYWERRGRTFEDADGYRVVLENSAPIRTAA